MSAAPLDLTPRRPVPCAPTPAAPAQIGLAALGQHLNDYARLTRVELYRTFGQLVAGYMLGGGQDFGYLAAVLVILAPGIYGGLYALNDVRDYDADRQHPTKCARPVAAGRISRRAAAALGLAHIGLGLAAAAALDWRVLALALLFVAINVLYTFGLKHVPYVEMVTNTLTHPLRLVAGLWLAGGTVPWPAVGAWFLAGLVITALKRLKERREVGSHCRPALRHYSEARLKLWVLGCLLGLAALALLARELDLALTAVGAGTAVAAVITYLGVPHLRRR
jgi:decaprenyl-phosphate phosphoribosyltransferase